MSTQFEKCFLESNVQYISISMRIHEGAVVGLVIMQIYNDSNNTISNCFYVFKYNKTYAILWHASSGTQ